jgi:hypothetical protein
VVPLVDQNREQLVPNRADRRVAPGALDHDGEEGVPVAGDVLPARAGRVVALSPAALLLDPLLDQVGG